MHVWLWPSAVQYGRRDARKQRSCRPSTTRTDDDVYRADDLRRKDRCIKLADSSRVLDTVLSNAHRIDHDQLDEENCVRAGCQRPAQTITKLSLDCLIHWTRSADQDTVPAVSYNWG